MPNAIDRRKFVAAASWSALAAGRVAGANDRIAIGVIGCGRRGLLREVLQFARESNAEVTAVCDTWRPMREQAAAQVKEALGTSPEPYVHYQDVVASRKIDAVIIGTPDHQHCTQLTAAARAGKDAYVEKPLAMNMKELGEAVEAVRKAKRVVQMGTQIRSLPASRAARAFVTSGGLGKILKVEQARNGYKPYWHPYGERPVMEADVDWKAFLMNVRGRPFNARQYSGWYGYREFSRGPQTNLMVHFIDLMHYITGAELPHRVMAMGGIYRWKGDYTAPDSVECVLEYPEGFLVRYGQFFGLGTGNYLKLYGTRGSMDAANWSWGGQWEISGRGSNEPDRIAEGATLPRGESVPHMVNFLQCIRTRRQPNAPIDAGYSHSVAAIMADESYLRGERMVYDARTRSIRKG